MDGVEAFRQIRTHHSGTRVILMSAFGVDDLKYQALDEGAIAFLEKPLDIDAVVDLIENAAETAILVVEPEEALQTQLHDSLKAYGYRVTTANSPHDTLQLLEQIRFDIILIDMELPAMSGLDLYLAIKRLTPASLAIMISGAKQEFLELAQKAVDQTAYTFVQKPLDLDYCCISWNAFTVSNSPEPCRNRRTERPSLLVKSPCAILHGEHQCFKSEIRISKSETNSNDRNSQIPNGRVRRAYRTTENLRGLEPSDLGF